MFKVFSFLSILGTSDEGYALLAPRISVLACVWNYIVSTSLDSVLPLGDNGDTVSASVSSVLDVLVTSLSSVSAFFELGLDKGLGSGSPVTA